jgi:CheY-like chemotaxis protein
MINELRDALAAMQMAIEVLRRPGDEASRASMLELLERQVAALRELADRNEAVHRVSSEGVPCRVLVVDDNIDSAEVLGTLLEQMGHEVFVAYTGARAIEMARERRPDTMLLDMALPDVSGLEVARTLRREGGLAPLRIIGLSGFGSDEHRRRAREAGLDDYLEKPVDTATLERLLGGRV